MAKVHNSLHITDYTKISNNHVKECKRAPLTWKSLVLMVAQLWLYGTQKPSFSLPK